MALESRRDDRGRPLSSLRDYSLISTSQNPGRTSWATLFRPCRGWVWSAGMANDPIHPPGGAFPALRLRRLRQHPVLRDLVRETTLTPHDFILPLFVRPGRGVKKEI